MQLAECVMLVIQLVQLSRAFPVNLNRNCLSVGVSMTGTAKDHKYAWAEEHGY